MDGLSLLEEARTAGLGARMSQGRLVLHEPPRTAPLARPIEDDGAAVLAALTQEQVRVALRIEVWRLAQAQGWPAVTFTTAEGWHRWQVEGGRAVWLGLLLRVWPAVLEAMAAALRASELATVGTPTKTSFPPVDG